MKAKGTYLVPTLYLGDWFLANAERLRIPPFILAKARQVMPDAEKFMPGHQGGAKSLTAPIPPSTRTA